MNEKINTKYKDRLFCLIFGKENYKENLLSLYNAVNNTDYKECTEIEINTIDDVIYMKMKNDVSCIFSSIMSIFEQQSTLNPNMPLRYLLKVMSGLQLCIISIYLIIRIYLKSARH